MTRVQFYHNTADPIALACELTARAHGGGRRIALRVADADAARRLDQALWRHEQLSFLPHVMKDSPLAAETPILIGQHDSPGEWAHQDLLFNLAGDLPGGFERFRMLIEIVGQHEADKAPARQRYKQYKQQGLQIQLFDAARREAM